MKQSIPITTKRKGADGEPEIRIFTMNDRQSELFDACVYALKKVSGWTTQRCTVLTEKAVVKLLDGLQLRREGVPRIFLELRSAFPILKAGDVHRLPRVGCPRGRVTGLILGHKETERAVLVELDEDQADFYNDAIREVYTRGGYTKDEAWIFVNKLVGRLLTGATLTRKTDDVLLMRAVNLFPGLTKEGAAQLPTATEDDVLRYSFTTDRVRS